MYHVKELEWKRDDARSDALKVEAPIGADGQAITINDRHGYHKYVPGSTVT